MSDLPDGYESFGASYLQPEWAAREGDEKLFSTTKANQSPGNSAYVEYTVPSGKVLYINYLSGDIQGYTAGDRDKNQMGYVLVYNWATGKYPFHLGGNGGCGLALPVPLVFTAGVKITFSLYNGTDHACNLRISVGGYEI